MKYSNEWLKDAKFFFIYMNPESPFIKDRLEDAVCEGFSVMISQHNYLLISINTVKHRSSCCLLGHVY